MKLRYLLPFIIFISWFGANAQTKADTAAYPFWLDMMADPSINFYKTQKAFNTYWENRPIEKGSGYKPFKRWEHNMLEVIDDKGNIPAPGVLASRVEQFARTYTPGGTGIFQRGGVNSATCLKSGNWVEIGPTSLPGNRTSQPNGLGRINALAFHPADSNILYAGAPAGGLWISKDGGKNWSTTTDTMASLGVSSIAVDPLHPDTIYIGTGDRDASDSYGRGIFRSKDGGVSWEARNTGLGNRIVGRLIIDPKNHNTLFAATNGGIFKTTNGGQNWSLIIAGNFKDIDFCPTNANYIYAATYGNCKFYRSTDYGATFTQVTSVLPTGQRRMVIGTTPADSNMVYVLVTESRKYKGLYLSTDKGLTFTTMSTTPNIMDYSTTGSGTGGQAWYDLDIVIDAKNKGTIYVGGVNIFQSLDSGKTWKINAHWVGSGGAPSIHADQHVLEIQSSTSGVFAGNDGGVYYTKNDGNDWTDISDDLGIAQIYRLSQSATVKDLVINGYQDNGTGLYENGSWFTVMGGDGMDCEIDPSDSKYAYSDLYYGDVRRYTNGFFSGKIAANGTNGITESGAWITPFVLQEGTPSTMFIGYKNLWRSTNIQNTPSNTVTWTKVSNNLAGSNAHNFSHIENSPADPSILYIAKAVNNFLRTDDINATNPTWVNLTANLPNTAAVQWIESDHKRPNTLWIAQSNKVYISTDKGQNWTNMSTGLPNIPVLSLVFDSSSARRGLYAGTYMGVFYKDTSMAKWEWFSDNLPIHTRVRDVEIYYSPQGRGKSHVVCATYGRGNWRSPLFDEDEDQPIAGFKADRNVLCNGETAIFSDTSANIPTQWRWEISPQGYTYVEGTDSCSQNPRISFITGSYTVKMVAANCGGEDSVEQASYINVYGSVAAPNCTGVTTNTNFSSLGLFGVNLAGKTVSNGSTKAEGGYLDFACTNIFDLKSDTTYAMQLNTGTTYNQFARIYIDFNDNGDLSDVGEMVWSTKAKGIHADSIKIPLLATTDKILRMRIMVDYDSIQNDPCDTLKYGQMEDYGVLIEQRQPTPKFGVDKTVICSEDLITITDSSEGPVLEWFWHIENTNGYAIDTIGRGPFTFQLTDTGYYSAELLLNDSSQTLLKSNLIYVKPKPTANLSLLSGTNLGCENRSLELKNTSTYPTKTDFSWLKDGASIAGVDSIFSINAVGSSNVGLYQAISSINGCIDTSLSLYINANPNPTATFTLSDDTTCLNTNQYVLTNGSTIPSGNMSYLTRFGDGATSLITNPSYSYLTDGTFDITLIATSDSGCIDSTQQEVVVYQNPVSAFSINQDNLCLKGNSYIFTNISSDNYGSLSWSWDVDGTVYTTQFVTHNFTSYGDKPVSLVATNLKNCTDTFNQSATVLETPNADFSVTAVSSCLNSNEFNFTNKSTMTKGSISSYSWLMGDGTTGIATDVIGKSYINAGQYNVRLIAFGDNACNDTITNALNVNPDPKLAVAINNEEQCLGVNSYSATNSTSISTGSIAFHAWDLGDGTTSTSNTINNHKYLNEGGYTINYEAETDLGCKKDTNINIIVHPDPVADFSGEDGCLGETIQFTNNSTISSGSITSNMWAFGDGNSSSDSNPIHLYSNIGSYNVSLLVISNEGCRDSLLINSASTILAKPVAEFSYQRTGSWEFETTIQFNDESTDATSWSWLFNNSNPSGSQNPIVTFTDTGAQQVFLVVEGSNGCTDSLFRVINVFPESKLYIPTSFTPNQDGKNDKFKPFGLAVAEQYSLKIFNRWGALVFESTNPSEAWDGTLNNADLPSGNYIYVIDLVDFSREKVSESGSVLLLR